MSVNIRKIEDLIKPYLTRNQKFISCDCKRLLPPGENYGSIMVQVQVKVLNEDGEEDVIHCVGKTCPPTELIREMFNTKVTFKKEIAVYETIIPTLNQFGREKGIDCLMDFFPKYLGARISLDPHSDVVDKDAVLLLENLKVQGYENCDRFIGFDLECARLLLDNLATMHAGTIAHKLTKPEEFNKKIRPHLNRDLPFSMPGAAQQAATELIRKMLRSNAKCVPYISKVEEGLSKLSFYTEDNPLKQKDLFATFTHNDFWVNNTLLKFENGKPIKNKMVDFQGGAYRSLAHDVVFFLYSSVELSVLEGHMDDLIKYYYERFVKVLDRLGCDFGKYSFENLMEDFAYVGKEEEFAHIMFMLTGIMTLKEKAIELADIKKDTPLIEEGSVHENCTRKIEFVVLDFVDRGWL